MYIILILSTNIVNFFLSYNFINILYSFVATGVTTGTTNKNNFILIFKTEESAP